MNKFRAKRTTLDGITFASKKEASRYAVLKMQERAGVISDLRLQQKFELIPKQTKPSGKTEQSVSYVADFVYSKDGLRIVEDVKGVKTKVYIIKRKLMLYFYGIEIHEV